MCRSSRVLAFLCMIVAMATPALSTPALARGGIGGGRAAIAPGLRVTAHIRPGQNPAVRVGFGDRRFGAPGLRGNPRAFGYGPRGRFGRGGYGGYGYGGYGLDAVGLGLDQANGFPFPSYGGGYGGYGDGGAYPPQIIPAALPPCPHPLIISIGHGLRHAVKSRIVYGSPPACGG